MFVIDVLYVRSVFRSVMLYWLIVVMLFAGYPSTWKASWQMTCASLLVFIVWVIVVPDGLPVMLVRLLLQFMDCHRMLLLPYVLFVCTVVRVKVVGLVVLVISSGVYAQLTKLLNGMYVVVLLYTSLILYGWFA